METILRITKKQKKQTVSDADFDELALDDDILPRRNKNLPTQQKKRVPYFWPGFFLGICLMASLALGSYWVITRFFFPPGPINIFIEMKVIDDEGHPVAGAGIFYGRKRIGVSDSFGEWSRFMKAPLGSTFQLLVRKENGREVMGALKNVAVPLYVHSGQEPRIKTNVHLAKGWSTAEPTEDG